MNESFHSENPFSRSSMMRSLLTLNHDLRLYLTAFAENHCDRNECLQILTNFVRIGRLEGLVYCLRLFPDCKLENSGQKEEVLLLPIIFGIDEQRMRSYLVFLHSDT